MADSFSEGPLWRDETDDKIAIRREFLEVTWMEGEALCCQELDCQVLVGTRRGDPKPAPVQIAANSPSHGKSAAMPSPADPPGRLR